MNKKTAREWVDWAITDVRSIVPGISTKEETIIANALNKMFLMSHCGRNGVLKRETYFSCRRIIVKHLRKFGFDVQDPVTDHLPCSP